VNASKNSAVGSDGPPIIAFKRQDRAIRTRQELTAAARRIFARDGFELARVEDIAAAAGKTRGAFYANFSDKEDVFFAIFEEDLSRDREQNPHLSEAVSAEDWIDAVAQHLSSVAKDRPRMQLVLEFKQYAIRHPQKQKRLADLHAAMCAQCAEADLARLIPGFANAGPEQKRTQSAQVGAILDGLALNYMFYGGNLKEEQMVRLLKANLRVVLGLE
jgi:AcrR family transcriptional regulator